MNPTYIHTYIMAVLLAASLSASASAGKASLSDVDLAAYEFAVQAIHSKYYHMACFHPSVSFDNIWVVRATAWAREQHERDKAAEIAALQARFGMLPKSGGGLPEKPEEGPDRAGVKRLRDGSKA